MWTMNPISEPISKYFTGLARPRITARIRCVRAAIRKSPASASMAILAASTGSQRAAFPAP